MYTGDRVYNVYVLLGLVVLINDELLAVEYLHIVT